MKHSVKLRVFLAVNDATKWVLNPSKNPKPQSLLMMLDYTILHWACQNINSLPLDIFKLLIETMGGDVNAQAKNNDTPLHIALFNFNLHHGGEITVLIYLLSQKNINVNNKG
jgi:ankyrin repeat protein